MARHITDYDGTVLPVDAVNLYGNIKDDPAGTKVNSKSNSDLQVFFQRSMALAGITPNGLPDNATNDFQLADAVLGKWTAFTPVFTTPSGGSISAGAVSYSKYTIVGKTLHWQVQLTGYTIAGGAGALIVMTSPSAANFPMNMQFVGTYNGVSTLLVNTAAVSAPGQVSLTLSGGGAFTNGTTNQNFFFNIVCELP